MKINSKSLLAMAKGERKKGKEKGSSSSLAPSASAPVTRSPSPAHSASPSTLSTTSSNPSSTSSSSSSIKKDEVEDLVQARLADGSTSSMSDLHLERNSVVISIVKANGLKNVELVGKSDPWVKVKLMDRSGVKERSFKTKFIRNNLDPEWNEEFLFIFRFGRSLADYLLQLEVYDHDSNKDTFLGMCTQSLMDIMGKRPGRVMEIKLEPKKSGQTVKGTVSCSCRYPNREEIEEMGANFSGKVAKGLVQYVTYSCADALCKLRPDAAIFECEAGLFLLAVAVAVIVFFLSVSYFHSEVSIFNIVFIYVLSILIPRGAPINLFEVRASFPFPFPLCFHSSAFFSDQERYGL